MTVGELRAVLGAFADDRRVAILLHNEKYPDGCQIFIQGVRAFEGLWSEYHEHPISPLVGLVSHDQNRLLTKKKEPRDG